MEHDILDNKYVEHGEFNLNLYGTRVDSCWDVVKSGKMCVLDVSPAVSDWAVAIEIHFKVFP